MEVIHIDATLNLLRDAGLLWPHEPLPALQDTRGVLHGHWCTSDDLTPVEVSFGDLVMSEGECPCREIDSLEIPGCPEPLRNAEKHLEGVRTLRESAWRKPTRALWEEWDQLLSSTRGVARAEMYFDCNMPITLANMDEVTQERSALAQRLQAWHESLRTPEAEAALVEMLLRQGLPQKPGRIVEGRLRAGVHVVPRWCTHLAASALQRWRENCQDLTLTLPEVRARTLAWLRTSKELDIEEVVTEVEAVLDHLEQGVTDSGEYMLASVLYSPSWGAARSQDLPLVHWMVHQNPRSGRGVVYCPRALRSLLHFHRNVEDLGDDLLDKDVCETFLGLWSPYNDEGFTKASEALEAARGVHA